MSDGVAFASASSSATVALLDELLAPAVRVRSNAPLTSVHCSPSFQSFLSSCIVRAV